MPDVIGTDVVTCEFPAKKKIEAIMGSDCRRTKITSSTLQACVHNDG
jgi:hypothetical protein